MIYIADSGTVRMEDLSPEITEDYKGSAGKQGQSNLVTLEEMEKEYIMKVLDECEGNKKKAAKILGIDRKTIYRKLNSSN